MVTKKIRDSKGLPKKYVYEGILSRSMFYKFENGICGISLEHFLEIADRLNISFNELEEFIDYHDGYRENLSIIMKFHYNGDIENLSKFSVKLDKCYREKGLIYYEHLSVLCRLIISYVKGELFKEKDVDIIKTYLFRAEYWMYYELSLFTNSLFIFDMEVIDVLLKKVLTSLHNLSSDDSDVFMLIANILSICFQKNDLNRIRKYIKILNSLTTKQDFIFSQFIKKFYTSLFKFAATGESHYEDEVRIHFCYLRALDLESMATSHEKLLDCVKLNLSK